MKILSADYVLPISAEPIADGAVAVEGSEIFSVGMRDEIIRQFPNASHEKFGKAAILPGFVNCHSHLEITALRGALDDVEHDFRSWLLRLNDLRSRMSDAEIEAAAIAGAIEGTRAGVTCFGDIGRYGKAGFEALKKVRLRGVLFQETEFSPDSRTADDDIERLKEKFYALRETATELVEVGLSPHSPYTVSPRLFEKIADFAAAEKIKITIHAAESESERELIENGTGFFLDFFKRLGLEWKSPRCSSLQFLERAGILQTKPLLAHCVTVSDADIEIIAKSGSSIAHCPKSNAKFGHGHAPFEKFVDAGITVGLGSDSVASNNVCDLLEESRFTAMVARSRPGSNRFISAREVLEVATLGGARTLGLDHKIGSLEAGKQADIAVVSLKNIAQLPVNEIHAALVFSSCSRDVETTMVAGNEVYRNGVSLKV
ncbi:MAG: amidohydrolase family protein [Pyrinomonadaceae bacterium]